MAYPPRPHTENKHEAMIALMRDFSFAHFYSSVGGNQLVTRLPFILDTNNNRATRLRSHLNANNPQAEIIEGADVLIAFSGPDSYVSPNWRTSLDRGATWDYTAVHVWGKCKPRPERAFFDQLVIDLASANERRFQGISSRSDWSLDSVTTEYVDRLFPALVAFEVTIERVEGIAKLHQDFPKEDAKSVADHLEKCDEGDAKAISTLIREHNGIR